jgi:hypothetical protein
VDEEAAMRSISMGAPRIMGFNHLLIGYQSAREMFDAFQLEEHNQIKGLFQFIEAQGMNVPLHSKDFFAFTKMYNTSDQAEHYRDMIQQYVGCFEYVVNSPESLSFSEQLFQPVKAIPGDCFSARVLEAHPPVRFSTIAGKGDPPIHETNPELYAAWRKQIQRGLENSNTICSQILSTFMKPYHSVIWMYRILFALGILAFITAAILVYLLQDTPFKALFMAALFVGLGSFSLLSWFLSRPLQSLEKNLHLNTCLGIIYNTYSTHLASTDPETLHDGVRCATNNAIREIERLIDNEAFLYKNSPNPPRSDKVSVNAGNNLIKNLSRTAHS